MTRHMAIAGGCILAFTVGLLAGPQQRDTSPKPDAPSRKSGTSQIAGRVMTADTSPAPIRRAIVSIAGDELSPARATITDDSGRFTFDALPAGTFTISAKKAAYLPAEFGATKPGRPGSRVALAAGEQRTLALTMFRGAAIGGTLRNPDGTPLGGVNVYLLNARSYNDGAAARVDPAVTNDRGEYRFYGVSPGDYIVAAAPLASGTGEIGARTSTATDALLAALGQHQKAGANSPLPAPVAPPAGYAPVYFPGSSFISDAQRIRLNAGDERESVSFEVPRVPVASIEGTISGNVPNLAGVQMAIVPEMRDLRISPGPASVTAIPPNEAGEFKFGNLAPGRYQIVGRARGGAPEPVGGVAARGRGSAGSGAIAMGSGETMFAVADVEVRGQNLKGLSLSLQPGGSLSGTLVFDAAGTAPPANLAGVRIGVALVGGLYAYNLGAVRYGNILSEVTPVGVAADGSFRITGMGPGRYTITCVMPNDMAKIWTLRSAVADGRDLLDDGLAGLTSQFRDVKLTLTDKKTELTGSLQSVSGTPINDYFVIAFSTNREHWRSGSRRVVSARPATDGTFLFSGLPSGEYFVAALADLDPLEWQETDFLAQVMPAAIKLTVPEGERKRQDLRVK